MVFPEVFTDRNIIDMAKGKKRPNYFRIQSPKLNKIFWWLCSALLAIATVTLAIIAATLISINTSEPGMDIPSLFPKLEPFIELVTAVYFILFMAFLTVVIYNYSTNREKDREARKIADAESPLQGRAVEHQEQIVELLKTIAQPLPGRAKLNRARTAQFLRALAESGYIDSNLTGKHLMVWVESVTGYEDGDAPHFTKAYKDATPQDTNVVDFRGQIEQMLA